VSRHRIAVTVSGEQRRAEVEARRLLVHFLREDLGVTSAHVGCDTTQCGACTVHLGGRAVKSCTVLAVQADGATVDTVESVSGAGDGEHPLLAAFREHHALQCGFCTPGMVMSSLELLRREPHPSEERVRAWLKGNFCRCTGYQHIVDAIQAAAAATPTARREAEGVTPGPSAGDTVTGPAGEGGAAGGGRVGEGPPAGAAAVEGSRFVGRPVPRREDDRHLRGRGRFTDDVRSADAAGTLHAALLRSPHGHARVRSVSVDRAVTMPGVVAVVTGADLLDSVSPLPASWVLPGMHVPVHRVLADGVVRFHGEGVAVVVAVDAALAIRLRRAVRWTATRSEDFQATNHGRDHVQDVELCATADGVITGVKATLFANLGAYLSGMAAGIPTANCSFMVTGVYRIPNIHVDTLGVLTNTSRVDTYRGAGRPEATYLIERMVDQLARELGLDPAETRRRNFIPADAFPYRQPTGVFVYDSGDYAHNLDTALRVVGYDELRREQAELRRRGRYRGIGLATYTEFTGIGSGATLALVGFAFGGWEYARVLVHPTGRVSVHVGSADQGQGHATSYAQIAADALGLQPDDIDIVEADTARVEFGLGTFNSRSMPVGGSAVHRCGQKVVAKAHRIAAHTLGAAVEDVRYQAAVFTAANRTDDGRRDTVTWEEVARLAHFAADMPPGLEPGLDERVFYQPSGLSFPFGTYVAVVDVDPETGDVTVDRFLAVDDCGPVINPMLARGQVHGGIAQGLGQALLEGARYDDEGRLAARDWTTYAVPRAQHLPRLETAHTVTPSPSTPLGVKGVGEAGAIGAPPAIVNAVLDALAPLGVRHLDMPLHPEQVLAAIRRAGTDTNASGGAP
jgi:carbon-monoxide dehydrogenase large subunit